MDYIRLRPHQCTGPHSTGGTTGRACEGDGAAEPAVAASAEHLPEPVDSGLGW